MVLLSTRQLQHNPTQEGRNLLRSILCCRKSEEFPYTQGK